MEAVNPFFEQPVLNGPYDQPARHWELDDSGQPTQQIIEPAPRRVHHADPQAEEAQGTGRAGDAWSSEGNGLSTAAQQYDPTSIINEVRGQVDAWRALPNPASGR